MKMILDLPEKLQKEILSRVPFTSLRAMRLTCTKWNTLSKSQIITKRHIDKAADATREGESRMISLMDYNLHLMKVDVNDNPSIAITGKLNCLDEQVKVSQVFHCQGLCLCILKDDDTRLLVWNPYLDQIRWIETRSKYEQHGCKHKYIYAFGYVNNRSHKILRLLDDGINLSATGNRVLRFEIYDFDSDLWSTTLATPPSQRYWRISSSQLGVSLKEKTYWCANSGYDELENHMICFDFTRESFGLLFCLPFHTGNHDLVTLSSVGEEKLAVLLQRDESSQKEIEIWISTKIESEMMSWRKFLKMDMGPTFDDIPIFGSFFVDEDKKVAMGFYKSYEDSNRHKVNIIGEDGYFRELDLGERQEEGCSATMCSFAPSSVQIKQTVGCKRKSQTSLEECQI